MGNRNYGFGFFRDALVGALCVIWIIDPIFNYPRIEQRNDAQVACEAVYGDCGQSPDGNWYPVAVNYDGPARVEDPNE